jgi:MFS family permease
MPLLPEFGALLGQDTSGLGYGMLIVAMSAGAVVGGVTLEAVGRIPASARLAIASTLVFAISIGVFAFSRSFVLSVAALFVAGISTIASSSISQTLVQLEAPPDRRGRFIGAYGMTSMGLRIGSGVLIGGIGLLVGAPLAVGIDAGLLALVAAVLLIIVLARVRERRRLAVPAPTEEI